MRRASLILHSAVLSLLLQIFLLGTILGGLSVLQRDAEVLVLGPLRRMLKIVARYARNPLAQPKGHHTVAVEVVGTARTTLICLLMGIRRMKVICLIQDWLVLRPSNLSPQWPRSQINCESAWV